MCSSDLILEKSDNYAESEDVQELFGQKAFQAGTQQVQRLQRIVRYHVQTTAGNSIELEHMVCRENEAMAEAQAGS